MSPHYLGNFAKPQQTSDPKFATALLQTPKGFVLHSLPLFHLKLPSAGIKVIEDTHGACGRGSPQVNPLWFYGDV